MLYKYLYFFLPHWRRRSHFKGEFHMSWLWLRSLMSTRMTGFTSVKEQFSLSTTTFPLTVVILTSWCALTYSYSSVSDCLTFYFWTIRPSYRKRKSSNSTEFSVRTNASVKGTEYPSGSGEAPAMLVPNLAPARSVREAIQEVKMVQVCSLHEFNSWYSQLVCSLHTILRHTIIHSST